MNKHIALRVAFNYKQVIYKVIAIVMKIFLNGEVQEVTSPCNLAQVFQQLRIDVATRCAVALNAHVISRDKFDHTPLQEGDELLIIRPTFGG